MKMNANQLISELENYTKNHLEKAEKFKNQPIENLTQRPTPESWNVLECLEHLNRYGDFYIPEMRRKMDNSFYPISKDFKSGILGNYFAQMMLPKEKLNKMKTMKKTNPIRKELDKKVIDKFIEQQKEILELLVLAKEKNLNKIKTGISISNWIRLKLGDTFRVVIYHNERHIQQAERALLL